jgi:hypothetical protein
MRTDALCGVDADESASDYRNALLNLQQKRTAREARRWFPVASTAASASPLLARGMVAGSRGQRVNVRDDRVEVRDGPCVIRVPRVALRGARLVARVNRFVPLQEVFVTRGKRFVADAWGGASGG